MVCWEHLTIQVCEKKKKYWGLLRKSQVFWEQILNPSFRIKCLAQIPLHYKVPQRSGIHFCQQQDRIKVRLQKIHRDLIFYQWTFSSSPSFVLMQEE